MDFPEEIVVEIQSNTQRRRISMDFPDEIVVEILQRLPVKTLVRFKCVSKSWRSLISNPTFVRTHLSRMKESHISLVTVSRMLLSRFAATLLSVRPHENDNGDRFAVAKKLELDPIKDTKYYLKGHCDGLLCLVMDNDKIEKGRVVLYNPSIGKRRILPLPPHFWGTREQFGIVYDPSIDDYKIVAVRFFEDPGDSHQVEILALKSKSNSWRKSWRSLPHQDTPPYSMYRMSVGYAIQTTNANGGLYWLFIDDAASRYVILLFDLVEENFRVVPLPQSAPDESDCGITWLGSLRDSLCVMSTQKSRASHFHVWSTKDDKTWTKLVTVPMLQGLRPSLRSSYLYKPLCYTKTGALLMKLRGVNRFVMFEPGENKFRKFAVRGVNYHLQETPYCESLVSPNCDGNQDEED